MPSFHPPCSNSVPTTNRQARLHTLPPAPDRDARRRRHLDHCEELGELGMDLARAAHREALRDMQPPPAPRTPIPGLPIPSASAPSPRDSVFGQLFALISRCVRQTMLLEDRLAARDMHHGTAEPAPRASQPAPAQQAAPNTPRPRSERLYQERLEDERQDQDHRPAHTVLDHIRSELSAASSGLAPRHQTPTLPRRPIPVIPPGPEPALTALERSAIAYHQTRPPKPPD